MHIKLSENPREWRKFVWQACVIFAGWFGLAVWRRLVNPDHWRVVLAVLAVVALAAWFRPAWFRGIYRFGMTASGWLGERVGRVLLTVFFFLLVMPLGWALRRFGYDPLHWRASAKKQSYWEPATKATRLDQMF